MIHHVFLSNQCNVYTNQYKKRWRHVDSCLTSSSFSVCDLSRHMLMAKLLFSSSSSFTLKTQNPVYRNVFVFMQHSAGLPWRNSFRQMSTVYAVAPQAADHPQEESLFSMQFFICSVSSQHAGSSLFTCTGPGLDLTAHA